MKYYAPSGNKVKTAIFRVKVKVKVTRSWTMVSFERASLVEYACQTLLIIIWLAWYNDWNVGFWPCSVPEVPGKHIFFLKSIYISIARERNFSSSICHDQPQSLREKLISIVLRHFFLQKLCFKCIHMSLSGNTYWGIPVEILNGMWGL